jgi:hypothetical protein
MQKNNKADAKQMLHRLPLLLRKIHVLPSTPADGKAGLSNIHKHERISSHLPFKIKLKARQRRG